MEVMAAVNEPGLRLFQAQKNVEMESLLHYMILALTASIMTAYLQAQMHSGVLQGQALPPRLRMPCTGTLPPAPAAPGLFGFEAGFIGFYLALPGGLR
jgi:hypothetical protein